MRDAHVVAGTGSRSLRTAERPVQVEAMRRVEAVLGELREVHGDRLMVMSGAAEGWDELLARVALRQGIPLWLAIPHKTYGDHYWGRASETGLDRRADFAQLVQAAAKVTYVMEHLHGTTALRVDGRHANFLRNDFMVDTADSFLIWDPSSTGTADCVRSIRAAGKWPAARVLSDEPAALPLDLAGGAR